MRLKDFLTISCYSLILISISGCSFLWPKPEKEIVVETKIVEKSIPVQARPRKLNMQSLKWHVVTKDNFDEFISNYSAEQGTSPWVFYAISVKGYEKLALNMGEIRRYIEQQKQIILYYEEAVKPTGEKKQDEKGNVEPSE